MLNKLRSRAKAQGAELHQDKDGLYWLVLIDMPDMRAKGPFTLEEVDGVITAAENGKAQQ